MTNNIIIKEYALLINSVLINYKKRTEEYALPYAPQAKQ